MRPRIVILILVVAFGVLGVTAVLKGVAGKHAVDAAGPAGDTALTQVQASAITNAPVVAVHPGSANPPAVSEELREALIENELGQVRALREEADGTNNPIIIAALLQKMSSPEAEVRKGVVEAFRELNDTNAVPGLLKAVESIQDPREKVAVLDAIEYIKAPDILAGVNPDDYTNNPVAATNVENLKFNPRFRHVPKNQRATGNNGGQAQDGGQSPIPDQSAPQPQ